MERRQFFGKDRDRFSHVRIDDGWNAESPDHPFCIDPEKLTTLMREDLGFTLSQLRRTAIALGSGWALDIDEKARTVHLGIGVGEIFQGSMTVEQALATTNPDMYMFTTFLEHSVPIVNDPGLDHTHIHAALNIREALAACKATLDLQDRKKELKKLGRSTLANSLISTAIGALSMGKGIYPLGAGGLTAGLLFAHGKGTIDQARKTLPTQNLETIRQNAIQLLQQVGVDDQKFELWKEAIRMKNGSL